MVFSNSIAQEINKGWEQTAYLNIRVISVKSHSFCASWLLYVDQWFSSGSSVPLRGHLAMSGGIFVITVWERSCYWHLVMLINIFYTQVSPTTKNDLTPSVTGAETGTLIKRLKLNLQWLYWRQKGKECEWFGNPQNYIISDVIFTVLFTPISPLEFLPSVNEPITFIFYSFQGISASSIQLLAQVFLFIPCFSFPISQVSSKYIYLLASLSGYFRWLSCTRNYFELMAQNKTVVHSLICIQMNLEKLNMNRI